MAKRGSLLLVVTALAAVAAGCGEEAAPAMPSFATDVKPLTLSRCVRCHGAGGKLNADPDSSLPMFRVPPSNGFFYTDVDPDPATCMAGTAAMPVTCRGLGYYAVGQPFHALFTGFFPMMPPDPAAKLTDRERQIIENWIANPLP